MTRLLRERSSVFRRLYILWATYLDHRFERRSPIPALSDGEVEQIFSVDLVFPPRKDLMRPGMQTIDGLFALGSIAHHVGANELFEIGTFHGLTTWFLGRNCPDGRVFTLDLPPDAMPSLRTERSDEFRARDDGMYYRMRPGAPNVVQHWGDSATFDFSPWRARCDLVYIDGAHSAEYVRSDTLNAFDMVTARGAVVWDDYWRHSPGTVSVLHDLLKEGFPLKRITGTRLVVLFKQ